MSAEQQIIWRLMSSFSNYWISEYLGSCSLNRLLNLNCSALKIGSDTINNNTYSTHYRSGRCWLMCPLFWYFCPTWSVENFVQREQRAELNHRFVSPVLAIPQCAHEAPAAVFSPPTTPTTPPARQSLCLPPPGRVMTYAFIRAFRSRIGSSTDNRKWTNHWSSFLSI